MRILFALLAGIFVTTVAAGHVLAADFPTKPIQLFVAYTAGGGADTDARLVAQRASEILGQSIIIQNRGGGGGTVAPTTLASAKPDGYTLLQITVTHAIAASLYKNLNYNILTSFVPVAATGSTSYVLALNKNVPANSVRELIALDKSGKLRLLSATTGDNGPTDLASKLFALSAGIKIQDIPYQGVSQAVTDLIGGREQMAFVVLPLALPLAKAGKIKALAVTGLHRSTLAPNLPTMSEAGVPGYQASTWFGIVAPAGTPVPILDKLHAAFTQAIEDPVVKAKMLKEGFEVDPSSRQQFAAFLKEEVARWAGIIHETGVK
jgi:tripartite-type tricarboxylate transporter receptor subunit TctC